MQMRYKKGHGREWDVRIVDGVARMCMAKEKEFGFTTRVNGPHAVRQSGRRKTPQLGSVIAMFDAPVILQVPFLAG